MKKYIIKKLPDELHIVHPQRFQIDYKNELNPGQYDAVTSVNGPHLVIAGAGIQPADGQFRQVRRVTNFAAAVSF